MRGFTHLRASAFLIAGMCMALFMFAGQASAQLSKDDQKCVNEINKSASKVTKAMGGDISSCVKDVGKGKTLDPFTTCITSDPKGKVAKQVGKLVSKVGSKCPGNPAFPLLDVSLTDQMNALAIAKELAIIAAILGTDLNGAIVDCDTDKDACKCQQSVIKQVFKCQKAKLGDFIACKKDELKGKNGPPVTSALELQNACLGTNGTNESIPDGKGKQAKDCGAKLASAISKKCPDPDQFPGCGTVNAAELEVCVEVIVECEVCRFLNALDNLGRNCDEFDNGVVDGSCISENHKCVFDDPNNLEALLLDTQISPIPFPLSGSLDINCGTEVDPNTGKAPCDCTLQDIDPLNIPTLGFVCLVPAPGCSAGEIDCDGGNVLDTNAASDHNVGACTGNADCIAQCASHCGAATVSDTGCEGFCEFGARDGLPCTQDDDDPNDPAAGCPDGSCAGDDGVPHGNICGCHCTSVAGAPSDPGDIACEMGTSITVETAGPCDGTDETINIGTACIPITTANASGIIVDANNTALKELPVGGSSDDGTPSDCGDLFASVTTGTVFVGKVNFFDSALGDLATTLTLACQ